MLVLLPLEEDSLLFRVCIFYGVLVLLLELLVPLLFQRRVRIEIPRVALRGPAVPLSTREFQQRRLALQQQIKVLQQEIMEIARRPPQKKRQVTSASASKNRLAASSSPVTSPTCVKVKSRSVTSWRTSEIKRKSNRKLEQKEEERDDERCPKEDEDVRPKPRQPPIAMGQSLATCKDIRQGGFSFSEAIQEDNEDENGETLEKEAMDMRAVKRRESPTFSGRRPVRLVSDSVDFSEFLGRSEAASRLETLIEARRRRRGGTSPTYVHPLPQQSTIGTAQQNSTPASLLPSPADDKSAEHPSSHASKPVQQETPAPERERKEDPVMDEDEETKESEPPAIRTDFQAFCASFAAGGSAAAQQATTKRKHHEAFGSKDEQTTSDATAAQREKYKHLRVSLEENERPNIAVSPAVAEPEVPKHYELFGSDDEQAIDEAFASEKVLEKRTHHQAFAMEGNEERAQEKTPRIVRRISFTEEVDELTATPTKETVLERSTGKRKRQQTLGMIDEDDDAEWRSSLSFQPHHFG